jgi:hypothetical protein
MLAETRILTHLELELEPRNITHFGNPPRTGRDHLLSYVERCSVVSSAFL